MKIKDIFTDRQTKVFLVTDQDNDNELTWTIEPTDFELIPNDENVYFAKAKQVFPDKTIDCFIGVMTPERIAETVIKLNAQGQTIAESIYDQQNTVIPAVASDCYGDYTLYYSKEDPQVGIDILRNGLSIATNKNVVAEDLGYILRDEEKTKEAIEAFSISEQFGPSSEYTFLELSRLYRELGQTDKHLEYQQKFKDCGGIEI